jgi:hypothetical protein
MARTASPETINKTNHVRHYISEHPGAGPKAIHEALLAQGHDISKALVNRVLYPPGKMRKAKRRGGRKMSAAPMVGAGFSLDHLLAAKKLVNQLGSVETAKQAVDALARLSG